MNKVKLRKNNFVKNKQKSAKWNNKQKLSSWLILINKSINEKKIWCTLSTNQKNLWKQKTTLNFVHKVSTAIIWRAYS